MNENFKIKYIPKKKGFRKIITYDEKSDYRNKHQKIVDYINKYTLPSNFAKAYIKKRSIITNAKAHLYNDIFLMMDVKSFFQNINHSKLIETLYYELNKGKNCISRIECAKIVDICSVDKKGIPIGLVSSPVLSNLYLKGFDGLLYGKIKNMNIDNPIYTRYADDLTISFRCGDNNYNEITSEIIKLTEKLLSNYFLKLNSAKTRVYSLLNTNHVRITGINIIRNNENYRTLTVGRSRKNKLFWDAINFSNTSNKKELELQRIKGMQSFILAVEGLSYEKFMSDGMKNLLDEKGYTSLKEFIDNLII